MAIPARARIEYDAHMREHQVVYEYVSTMRLAEQSAYMRAIYPHVREQWRQRQALNAMRSRIGLPPLLA